MLVRLDLDQTTDPLRTASAWVINRVTLANHPGVDAEEYQFSNELVGPEFESKRDKLFVVRGDHLDAGLLMIRVHADGGRDVERTWQVVDYRV